MRVRQRKPLKTHLLLAALALTLIPAAAAAPASPYAGQESRPIKTLSPEDVQAYLSGKGMGLAKAAELNGYPGPSHVLELATELGLTSEQRQRTQALFATMQAKAIDAGRQLVEAERALDESFAARRVTPASLESSLERIGSLQSKVRAAHLDAHLAQSEILSSEQVARYSALRGYTSPQIPQAHGQHRH
jgi:Spy/CpxP family protein refolding chaperone